MKYKLICLTYIIGMFFLIGILSETMTGKSNRIHQHRMKEEILPCTHEEDEFCTHLPIISITTDTNEIKVFDKAGYNNHLSDEAEVVSLVDINARGNSSKDFDKKQYNVKLMNEDGSENTVEMLGMPKHDEWILNGPFHDKTLMRNYVGMNISAEIMGYAPQVRYCELFIDGSYKGVYLLLEKIQADQNRVNLTKYKAGDLFASYIVRLDRGGVEGTNLDHFSHYAMKTESVFNVVYPSKRYLDERLIQYIEQDISRFEKALYSYDYKDRTKGYRKYIDVQSFVDYMIINEFFQNIDAGSYSTYLYKDIRGKLNIGPVWDFNNAADNYFDVAFDATGFTFMNKVWYYMLLKDPNFTDAVVKRYETLRKTTLNEDYLLNYIDDTVAYLGEAVDRNFEVWGYTFSQDNGLLEPKERNIESYEEAIKQLKNFIIKRGRWLDENIDLLYQYSHESKTKKFNH